jgi:hypothetical protein
LKEGDRTRSEPELLLSRILSADDIEPDLDDLLGDALVSPFSRRKRKRSKEKTHLTWEGPIPVV